jgi:hypothetical protein
MNRLAGGSGSKLRVVLLDPCPCAHHITDRSSTRSFMLGASSILSDVHGGGLHAVGFRARVAGLLHL